MANAQEIKSAMSKQEYEKVFDHIGIEYDDCGEYFILCQYDRYPLEEVENHKKKLYCYFSDHNFINYVSQWHGDIFSFLQEFKRINGEDCDFIGSLNLVENILGDLSTKKTSWGGLRKYSKKLYKPEFKVYDENILKQLPRCHPEDWRQYGIIPEVFDKYELGYYNRLGQTVIPVRNNGQLVGIRIRNNNPYYVESLGKYGILTTLDGFSYTFPSNGLLYGADFNRNAIEEAGAVMLVEGEKSCMKSCSLFKDESISLAMFGKNLNEYKRKLLKQMGVNTIYYCADADYSNPQEYEEWLRSLKRWSLPVIADGFNLFIVADWKQEVVGVKDNIFDTKNAKDFKKIWNMKRRYE